jgi:peptide/nickel transport system permease protein
VVLDWDWGLSIRYRRPVSHVLAEALPNTCLLALAALLIQYLLGTSLGVASAMKSRSRLGQALDAGALLIYSIPTFWLALLGILLFSRGWPHFPPSHMHSPGAEAWPPLARLGDLLWHLALPALVLGLSPMAAVMRFTRQNVAALLSEEPVRAARARGLSEARILGVHVLKPASRPLTQLLGLSLPGLLSGALVVEVVFSWPGLGSMAMEGLLSRDYPLLLATTAWSGGAVVLGSLVADLLLLMADPRTRHEP